MQKRSEPKSVFMNRINPAGIEGREGGGIMAEKGKY